MENVTEQKGRSWHTAVAVLSEAASLAAVRVVLVSREALQLGGSTTATSLIWTFADIYSDIPCKTVSLSRRYHPAFLDFSSTNQFCKTSRWPNYFLCFEEKCCVCALPFSPCNASSLYHVAPCEDSWPNSSWVLWVQVRCCAQARCSCEVTLFLGPGWVCLCGTALQCVDVLVSLCIWLGDLQHSSALHGVSMPVFARLKK